jgi:hypothetical protein
VLAPAAVLALGLGGLPLTGGWLAKLAIKPVLGGGLVGILGSLSSAGTTLLMIHFLARLAAVPAAGETRAVLTVSRCAWLGLAFASIGLPWLVVVTLMPGVLADAASFGSLVDAGWPVLLGVALAAVLAPLRHRAIGLAGADALALGSAETTARLAEAIGASTERLDLVLRRWPVAATLLLALAALFAGLMLAAG